MNLARYVPQSSYAKPFIHNQHDGKLSLLTASTVDPFFTLVPFLFFRASPRYAPPFSWEVVSPARFQSSLAPCSQVENSSHTSIHSYIDSNFQVTDPRKPQCKVQSVSTANKSRSVYTVNLLSVASYNLASLSVQ
jgi:hypothetical protein